MRMKKNNQTSQLPANNYNEHSWIIGKPNIGKGTWVGAFTIIDGSGGLKIGKNCDISCGVHIYTHSTAKRCVENKRFNKEGTINRKSIERKKVEIGDNTFIGPNSVINMGVKIGHHCIIGACSVVTKDVPPFSFVAGTPAKIKGKIIFDKNNRMTIKYL